MLIFSLRREAHISGEAASFALLRQIFADLGIACEVPGEDRSDASPSGVALRRYRQLQQLATERAGETFLIKIPTGAQLPFVRRAMQRHEGRFIVWIDGLLWRPVPLKSMGALFFAEPGLNVARAIINNRAWLRGSQRHPFEIVVASQTQRAELAPLLSAAQIHVVPNGSPPRTPALSIPDHGGSQPTLFGYIGHTYRTKGVTNLLEAWRILKKRGLELPMELALSELGGKAIRKKLAAEGIRVRGRVEPSAFYPSLRALVAPYWTDWGTQTFPNILLEALEFGVPVITSDLAVCRELFPSGLALFVPPNDSEALARTLEQVHSGKVTLPSAERLRAHFEAHFSRDRIAAGWRAILAGSASASSSATHG